MNESYTYHLYSPRPDYGTTPVFYHRDDLPKEGFASLYGVDKQTSEAIVAAGTTKGFRGVVWSERLWIDVDSYEAADTTECRLKEMGYDYIAYDSGGRGGHFGILRDSPPSHLLPQQDKQWVQENIKGTDTSVYSHLHPFRLPGTTHHRTGKRKELVGSGGKGAIILPPYKEGKGASSLGTLLRSEQEKSIFDIHFIARNSEPAKEGERHAQLIRLIYALKENGYDVNIARWYVGEVNKRFNPMKSENEIEKILGSIYR